MKIETVTLEEYDKLRTYCMALERSRADLWGVNEELRNKIAALERGQEDLLLRINELIGDYSRPRTMVPLVFSDA